jgi:hypothetical protein
LIGGAFQRTIQLPQDANEHSVEEQTVPGNRKAIEKQPERGSRDDWTVIDAMIPDLEKLGRTDSDTVATINTIDYTSVTLN